MRQLLSGTGYGFEIVDAKTVRIMRTNATSPKIDEIVVTATKLPTPLDRLPYSISVVSGARLAEQRIAGARDLAADLAGITVTNLGPGRNKILIRGLSDGALTGATQSTVGIYLDDARITYNAPDPDLKLIDVQEVDILRGPQGDLYGSGSIGGIYRIVTNKPDLTEMTPERSRWARHNGAWRGERRGVRDF